MFEELFLKSKGKPILYQGDTVYLAFKWKNITAKNVFKLIFESVNSKWRQGVVLRCTKGFVRVFGTESSDKGILLWANGHGKEIKFLILDDNEFWVNNVWDTGSGTVDSFHNGAAMKVVEIENGYRFYSNDGFPDDDFDDIVFSITIIDTSEATLDLN